MPSIDGLVTGLDTTKIIEGLLSVRQQQLDRLSVQQDRIVEQQNAFKEVEARLLVLQADAARLNRLSGDIFRNQSANSSNTDALEAAASTDASPGIYQLQVSATAKTHQVATQGFASPDSEITQGTIELRVGSGTTYTIQVNSSNNTLEGLATTINNSGADVTASIIQDGSGATPYRLLLSSRQTGTANAITLTNNLANSSGNATRPDFDFNNPVQEAEDAEVTLGTGPGAITVTSASNTIDDLIPGVTLKVRTTSASPIDVTVSPDTEPAKEAIVDLVNHFNEFMELVDEQIRFDPETNTAGILLGNVSLVTLQDDVRRAFTDVVEGVSQQANRLSAVGITVTANGRLSLNESKLDDALSGRIPGITIDDVRRMFALDGVTTNPNIRFVLGSSRTMARPEPYEIDVLQVAERGEITAANNLSNNTNINSSNNTLVITVDGRTSETLTLTNGTYTRDEMAAHLQDVINSSDTLAGAQVTVSVSGNKLHIRSNRYGLSSEVTIVAGTALNTLGFDGTESDIGQDVVGNFIVDGTIEPATGSGQFLIGDSDNAYTADLQVQVTMQAGQVVNGPDAQITVTRGVVGRLDQLLDSVLDPVTGRVKTMNDGFAERIKDLDEQIEDMSERFERQQASLVEQFAALESAVADLRATSDFLAAQLAALSIGTR